MFGVFDEFDVFDLFDVFDVFDVFEDQARATAQAQALVEQQRRVAEHTVCNHPDHTVTSNVPAV